MSIYDRTTFTNKTVANTSGGLPSNTITYIYEDAVNNTFWIGTDAGVAKYIP
ncbi:MAG: hypothetical protein H6767_07930 [Candidatus Peribacteria bacterium]|nr:MAG: hypothetical protein H6767_07930 [Candidatus Peribacteria bacterium]